MSGLLFGLGVQVVAASHAVLVYVGSALFVQTTVGVIELLREMRRLVKQLVACQTLHRDFQALFDHGINLAIGEDLEQRVVFHGVHLDFDFSELGLDGHSLEQFEELNDRCLILVVILQNLNF